MSSINYLMVNKMITVERSKGRLYWEVVFNGVVLSAGHSRKYEAEATAAKLRQLHGMCA